MIDSSRKLDSNMVVEINFYLKFISSDFLAYSNHNNLDALGEHYNI